MRPETGIDRLPPQNIEAEQVVLGSILIEGEAILKAIEALSEEDFYRRPHRQIYSAMLRLFEKNEAIDIVTVSEELRKSAEFEDAGGTEYLSLLANQTPTAANIWYYAKIVKDKSLQRDILRTATEVAERVYQGDLIAEELMDMAEKKIFEISERRIKASFTTMKTAIKSTFKMIESLYDKEETITGIPSGFRDLDTKTAGFQPGDLIVLGGRPSSGKTAFGLNIAEYVAIEIKEPVAIFSLEMSLQQVILRMLCSEAEVDASSIRRGYVKQNFHKLANAAGRLVEAPIYVDDTSALTALEMRAKARRLKREHGLSLMIVDYLQLMKGSGGYEQRVQEISEISRSLKALAKELNVPVIALSQLNRAVERERRAPNMADLRESGAIEQDADVILFLYRDETDKHENDNDENIRNSYIVNLTIAKQRNGPITIKPIPLTFMAACTRFRDSYIERRINEAF